MGDRGRARASAATEDGAEVRAPWFRPLLVLVPLILSFGLLVHTCDAHRRASHHGRLGAGLYAALPPTSLDELTDYLANETGDISRRFAFEELQFERARPKLTRRAQSTLDGIAVALAASPRARIVVEAHGGTPATPEHRRTPSLGRAIKDALVARGLDPGRITLGYASNDPAGGSAEGRLTEIVVSRR